MMPDADEVATLRSRYRFRDPRRNEWTAGDIARGWLIGVGVLLVGSLVVGIVLVGEGATVVVLYAGAIGLPTLTVYGVPVACGAAALLRRVRAEWMHLVAFAVLGCLGGALGGNLWKPSPDAPADPTILGVAILLGTTTAVLARALAKVWAIRLRG